MATRPLVDFDRAVSAYIRSMAATKKISMKDIAKRSGIPYDTFKRYWGGTRSVSVSDLRLIVSAFGVSPTSATEEIWRTFETGEYLNQE